MKKLNREQLNNKGFSLVELIVVMLMSGFIATMVMMFISTSRKSYETVNTSYTLQSEALTATTYMNELLLEAQDCGLVELSATVTDADSVAYSNPKVVWIQAPNNYGTDNKSYIYFIVLENETGILRFGRRACESSEVAACIRTGESGADRFNPTEAEMVSLVSGYCGDKYSLLAQNVENIEMPSRDVGSLVSVVLDLKYNDTSYTTTLNVTGRNLK